MLRNMISFYHMANEAVERTAAGGADGQRITYNVIRNRLGDVLYKLRWACQLGVMHDSIIIPGGFDRPGKCSTS